MRKSQKPQKPTKPQEHTEAKRNLRLVAFESIITAGLLSMPIMSPFFLSLGLSQSQIALSQVIFTVVIMLFGLPAGWIADRFSRKWANVIGDFGIFITLLLYSQVQGFAGIVIAEIAFGIFLSFSQGVDASLLKHFSGQIDPSGKHFQTTQARVSSLQFIFSLILVLLGGPIGAISFRLAIALSSLGNLAGGIAALFIKDDSEKLIPEHQNPLKDMVRVTKSAVKDPQLRLRLFAYAITREVTHGIIWVFTPLLLLAGVPLSIVSVGWVFNYLACLIGSELARAYATRFKAWQVVALPMALAAISTGVMSLHFSLTTVWLYLIMGVVQGWSKATMTPLVLKDTTPSEQNSILALAATISRLLYVPSVWLIGLAADIKLEYSLLATFAIFIPLAIPVLLKLRKEK